MTILVIDGQGGGMGAALVAQLKDKLPGTSELICVGTNALATAAMLKAGAGRGATGENAVVVNAPKADIILGPLGILLANGIMGEVSPAMAAAISGSDAQKIVIPSSHCGCAVVGVQERRLEDYLKLAVGQVLTLLGKD